MTLVYCLAGGALCVYGLHRLWLAWRGRGARKARVPARRFASLPAVTVQVPLFNEPQVAERVIEAVCALDYPREALQIQVLDDSTDDSASLVRACCARMVLAGHPVSLLHRSAREGFKSGALAAGLEAATGELIAFFDADFVPPPDFLLETVHHFTDPEVGMVQAEWSHLNRERSLLTELQAIFLDGHFIVEQAVRSARGRWFNFNGTAGVWRRTCIEDAGGWQHDTLTEDTDLSYRAQLRGWRFLYLPTVRCPAELPATMTAFIGQQHRWTKGLIQTARKLVPRILTSPAPMATKAEAVLHLGAPLLYALMFLLSAIALPAMLVPTPFTERPLVALAGEAVFSVGALGAVVFYLVSQRLQGRPFFVTLMRVPLLMALGVGLCVVNTRAVLEALLGLPSPFVRTPKVGTSTQAVVSSARFPAGLLELSLAGVLTACLALTFRRPFTLIGAPFLFLCVLGYASVGLARLLEPLVGRTGWARRSVARVAGSALAAMGIATGALGTMGLARWSEPPPPPAMRIAEAPRYSEPLPLAVDLTAADWQPVGMGGAVRAITADGGVWALDTVLSETSTEGSVMLDLNAAAAALGRSTQGLFLGSWFAPMNGIPERQLVFEVEVPPRFVGELQAFVRDGRGRLEYGPMSVFLGSDNTGLASVLLTPRTRTPPMGYRDEGFDPVTGIEAIGLKVSAQSDRARGPGYRPFSGTIRLVRVGIANVRAEPTPERRLLPGDAPALRVSGAASFSSASGLDRPWPLGYGFAGPLTSEHTAELERTYGLLASQGRHFTRVYVGDYREGLLRDATGKVSGVDARFSEYLDRLAEIANRNGVTVMFSLTDNAMLNGGEPERLALVREGEASDAFVTLALAELVSKLAGRDVIWDLFNEPENVTSLPLLEVQRYVDRALAAGRRADPKARFTVVSRSRPELAYWRGRGLDLYAHNLFTERSLAEALDAPRTLEAPILVAEMGPGLVTPATVEALRQAGYSGVGIWGWGTLDKYQCPEAALLRLSRVLDQETAGDALCNN